MNNETLALIAKEVPAITALVILVVTFLTAISRMNREAAGREKQLIGVIERNTEAITKLVETVKNNTVSQNEVADEVRQLKSLMYKGQVVSSA